MAVGDVLRLGRLDFAIDELLQRRSGLVGRRLDLVFRRPLQRALRVIQVFPVGKGDKILELRLNELAGPLALEGDGVVANISFRIDLKSKCVTCSGLNYS